MSDKKEENYQVGYGKPPKHSQYKKGQASSNPGGRPKKSRITKTSIQELINKELLRVYKINTGSGHEDLPAMVIVFRKMLAQAMQGDIRSAKFIEKYYELLVDIMSLEGETIKEDVMKRIANIFQQIGYLKRSAGADENGLLPGETYNPIKK